MRTRLEQQIELEDAIKAEARNRFPALDPDWVAKKILDRNLENTRKMTKILVAMWPEVKRIQIEGEKEHGASQKR